MDRFSEFITSSGSMFQSVMVTREMCLMVSMVQMGSLSDFDFLICVFLVLKYKCESAGIATMAIYYFVK